MFGKEVKVNRKLVRIGLLDGEGYQFVEDPATAVEALKRGRAKLDVFTFIPRISEAGKQYEYYSEMDNMAVLRVTTFEDWNTNTIDFKVRNKTRKAGKAGVEIREAPFDDALIRGIHGVYNDSPMRQGKAFKHYGKDLETVREMSATFLDRSIFVGAYLKEEMIGFIKLVTDETNTQAGLMHIVSMISQRDKAPTNALLAYAIKVCAERKIPNLWYANMEYANKQQDSLADFKRANGFEKVDIPRYYVPLTVAGRIALRWGLHRDIAEIVPESVASRYRNLRKYWLGRKVAAMEQAGASAATSTSAPKETA